MDLNWFGGLELREVRLYAKDKSQAGGDEAGSNGIVGVDGSVWRHVQPGEDEGGGAGS